MMPSSSSAGILPSYQRFVNGVQPGQLFARRSFRPREKYLILLVFVTFGIVCFGAFFFLPEDFRVNGGVNSVYKVYQRMQKAGPELLIPAPPRSQDDDNFESDNRIKAVPIHHGDPRAEDVHLIEDKQKLQAKIDEEYQNQKTLEKPEVLNESRVRASYNSSSTLVVRQYVETHETVPPEPSERLPKTVGGEDKDPIARQRRDKVKENQTEYALNVTHSSAHENVEIPLEIHPVLDFGEGSRLSEINLAVRKNKS